MPNFRIIVNLIRDNTSTNNCYLAENSEMI